MNDADIKALHTFLLLTLNACGEVGIQESGLLPRARMETFSTITAPQLSAQLRALADRKLVQTHQPTLGAERWKITSLGRAALEEAGLA